MYIDLEKIDKKFDDAIFLKAKALRKEMADYLIENSMFDVQHICVEKTMLKSVLERTPFEDTEYVLKFNIYLTEKVTKNILDMHEISDIEKIALYAYAIELGAREFINPKNRNKVYSHLGAAKDAGFFFTPPSLAIRMVMLSMKYNIYTSTLLDPACGAGVFLAYYILLDENLKKVTGIEIDELTSNYARQLIEKISETSGRNIEINILCDDFFTYFEKNRKTTKFESIIMNPPYGNLKFLLSDLSDSCTRAILSSNEKDILSERIRQETMQCASQLRKQFMPYGMGKGTLEYSKLFMSATHELLAQNGFIVAITPSSWLGDETSVAFRNKIIKEGFLYELWMIPEIAKLFKGVNQPTAVSVIGKKSTDKIVVKNPILKITDVEKKYSILDLDSLLLVSGSKVKFPKCNYDSLKVLMKLQECEKLGNVKEIVNARGELDLTAYKKYVSKEDTGHRLIRGDHIEECSLKNASESDKAGYVVFNEFMDCIRGSTKAQYVKKTRIAIPQCSYLQKKKRIEAAIVPANCIISNSCNFLSLTCDADNKKQFYYWILLNSSILEWQFRIFSYNNHVANKELAELPCVSFDNLDDVQKLRMSELYREGNCASIFKKDAYVAHIFDLSKEEYKMILTSLNCDSISSYLEEYNNALRPKNYATSNAKAVRVG